MTVIVELYGGPGCGKSTTAAKLFAMLKGQDVNAELVTEVAKEWAWQDRKIRGVDSVLVATEQLQRVDRLLGKVAVLVTDSPGYLQAFYGLKHSPYGASIADLVYRFETVTAAHPRIRRRLIRTKVYNPKGRFESEEEARKIDTEMANYVWGSHGGLSPESIGTDDTAVSLLCAEVMAAL